MTKTQKTTYWVLLALLSLGFIAAAIPKLIGDPMAAAGFAAAHLPIWFMYFIGVCEILGAIGLWVPRLQKWAAYGLFIILAGAVITTAIFVSSVEAALPLVYAIILWIILWLSAKRTASMPTSTPVSPSPTV
jgi:uncharacterized membrane protein YphA (DoxX/SURF4 family)